MNLPVYAKLFGGMALVSGTFAVLIGVSARQEWQLYSTGTPTPADVPLASLTTDGAGGNLHVHVTDLQFGPAYALETTYGTWERIWIPVLSRGRVRAVVKTSDVKDAGQLGEFRARPGVTGVVTNDLPTLKSVEFERLRASYPDVHFYSLPVIEEGRRFPTAGSVWRMIGVTAELTALAAVTGLVALVIALRKRRPACRAGEAATAAPARPGGNGPGALPRPEGPASAVTGGPGVAVGAGFVALRPAELPEDAAAGAPSSQGDRNLGGLRRFFSAGDLFVHGIGCGVYWLLLWGGIVALVLEQAKPGQPYSLCAFVAGAILPAVVAIAVGVLVRRDAAALYAEGVVSWRWGRTMACRWDEVESVAGKLRLPGRSALSRSAETLRLRMVDGRTVVFGDLRDEDELVDAIYHEVLGRQLPRALAAIRRGETVSVGPLLFRSDGIGDDNGQWLARGDVESVSVRGDKIVVQRYGARTPWWSGDLEIPNAALLLELATACRRGEFG
jgi:hypothetical protein